MHRYTTLLMVFVVGSAGASGSAQILVPDGFVVEVLHDQIDGSTPHLEVIRNPAYGSGVVAASCDGGIVTVLRLSHSSIDVMGVHNRFLGLRIGSGLRSERWRSQQPALHFVVAGRSKHTFYVCPLMVCSKRLPQPVRHRIRCTSSWRSLLAVEVTILGRTLRTETLPMGRHSITSTVQTNLQYFILISCPLVERTSTFAECPLIHPGLTTIR